MTLSLAVPNQLMDPGYVMCAPPGSTIPITTPPVGGFFTDAWDAAWLPVGATAAGSEFTDGTTVSPVTVAEFVAPTQYRVTDQKTEFSLAMAHITLSNFKRARNGGAAALAPVSGSGGTALYTFSPPVAGAEVRMMIGWESLDHTMRLIIPQVICSGDVKLAFQKAPNAASIPVVFSAELPLSGPLAGLPYVLAGAGSGRGGL